MLAWRTLRGELAAEAFIARGSQVSHWNSAPRWRLSGPIRSSLNLRPKAVNQSERGEALPPSDVATAVAVSFPSPAA